MAYVEGKSHREIARELKLPIGTVKSRARLAFQRIRGILEKNA
jgi:RNA polymerase sigma-70 factor (ECF subfamily)